MKIRRFNENQNNNGPTCKIIGQIVKFDNSLMGEILVNVLTALQEHISFDFVYHSDDSGIEHLYFKSEELLENLNKFLIDEKFRDDVMDFFRTEYGHDADITTEQIQEILYLMKDFKGDILIRV